MDLRRKRALNAFRRHHSKIPNSNAEWQRTTKLSRPSDSVTRDLSKPTWPALKGASATVYSEIKFDDRTPDRQQRAGTLHGQVADEVGRWTVGSTAAVMGASSLEKPATPRGKNAYVISDVPPGSGAEHVIPNPPVVDVQASSEATKSPIAKSEISPKGKKAQPVRITRFENRPVIDGHLDDEVWQRAAVLGDFYQIQPGDNISPSKPTEVLLGYDAKFLYVAFRAHDDPGKVRATVAKRDAIFADDSVTVYLDTFNDKRRAYKFSFNPLGVQADAIFTEGGGEDGSLDILMESKGMLTEDGYTVEVAIPFKSLRYAVGKDKLWGVHCFRSIKRFNNEQDSWMPITRGKAGLLNQSGYITGLEGIATERTLEIIPTLTLSEAGGRVRALPQAATLNNPAFLDRGRFINQPIEFDPGLTMKFGITPSLTLDFALNPDFADVEADQPVVTTNQRFPIFFAEKRPFFLEGIDIFQTPLTAVHTRAIVDPDYAVKLTGKLGRNSFGMILASDNAPGNFSKEERLNPGNFRFLDKNAYVGVLRLRRDVGKESSLGLIATSYNFIEKHNQLGGFDGRFRLNPQTDFSFQVLGTTSRRFFFDQDLQQSIYRTGNGLGYSWSYNKAGRHFFYNLSGEGRTRDYIADVGFTRRTNTNSKNLFFGYYSEPKPKAKLISWSLSNNINTNFDWQGHMQNWGDYAQVGLNFKHQTYLNMSFSSGYERLFEEEFGLKRTPTSAGTFLGDDPERTTYQKSIYVSGGTTPSKKYGAYFFLSRTWNGFDYDYGAGLRFPRVSSAALIDPNAPLDPGPGNSWNINATFIYQPTDALSTSFSYTRSKLVRNDTGRVAYDDHIYFLHTTYQFTRFTFARARINYDTLSSYVSGQFLFGWTPNPGTSFYFGYNDNLTYNGFSPFTGQLERGFRRNGRTFFIKMSYLFRRSLSK